jgi:hypothetical protein
VKREDFKPGQRVTYRSAGLPHVYYSGVVITAEDAACGDFACPTYMHVLPDGGGLPHHVDPELICTVDGTAVSK